MFFMGVQKTKRKGSESPLCRLFTMSAALDFRKCKRLFRSSLADILASRGSRRRRHDAPRRAKSLLLSVVKQKRTSKHLSVLFGGTVACQIELLISKRHCFAVVNRKLR